MFRYLFLPVLLMVALAPASASGRGLAGTESVFVPKGTIMAGLAGGFNSINAEDGGNVAGIITNADGNLTLCNVHGQVSWFVQNDIALGVRFGYADTAFDGNSLDVLDIVELTDRHLRREMFEASLSLRRYLSIFGSDTFGFYAEGRLTGGRGYLKSYKYIERGKVGSYSDIYSVNLGLYAGVCAFITDKFALELSLPLASGGMEWSRQIESQENESAIKRGGVAFKPQLLGLNLGLILYF
jgi:hypothetical protein